MNWDPRWNPTHRYHWDKRWRRSHGIPMIRRRRYRHWEPGGGPPPWMNAGGRSYPRRHKMFLRIALVLIVITVVTGGFSAVASHIWSNAEGAHPSFGFFWVVRICGLVLGIPFLIFVVGSRIFRSYAVPLADIMDAAEEVATGNLQVRVEERGSPEFKQLAGSFNRMTEELARTDQQRRNLTADVAHELRTPLHIIQGNLEGILDGVYAPTPEHIEATLQETRTLSRLVEDLRTLSLAESGQLTLHPEVVDVHDLLADVATSFSAQAESARIQLRVKDGAEDSAVDDTENDTANGTGNGKHAPLTLYGDPGRLDQVLGNLVSNALRHTPAGGSITLSATPVHNGNGEQIQLAVADTGEGIAPDDLPFVFDRFWRGDRARTHKEGTGSGLGLAITGQLVKAHGGAISVESEVGHGATFTVTLPANAPGASAIPKSQIVNV